MGLYSSSYYSKDGVSSPVFTVQTIETYTFSIPRRIQFAKQSVVLHGWANKHFAEDRQAIQTVHQKMSANYKEGALKGWDQPNTSDSDLMSREYSTSEWPTWRYDSTFFFLLLIY